MSQYECPSCGFHIFNRRVPKCESCGVMLPKALLFNSEQIAALDAEHERDRKLRRSQARKGRNAANESGSLGGEASWTGGDGGSSGCGGDGGGGGGCD